MLHFIWIWKTKSLNNSKSLAACVPIYGNNQWRANIVKTPSSVKCTRQPKGGADKQLLHKYMVRYITYGQLYVFYVCA
jgi:heme oxygenase